MPLPETPETAFLQRLSLNKSKVTDPDGLAPPDIVAVSPTVVAVPTTMSVVGLAWVKNDGLAFV